MRDRMRRWLPVHLTVALALVAVVGLVVAPPAPVDRTGALARELRCPVCQGESVADSPSDTAEAIEAQIADMVAEGWSDEEIRSHFVARYGRWVLLDPPVSGDTVAVWGIPLLAGAAGATVLVRRRRDRVADLDDERRERVADAVRRLRERETSP